MSKDNIAQQYNNMVQVLKMLKFMMVGENIIYMNVINAIIIR